jgi:hypothetical protein
MMPRRALDLIYRQGDVKWAVYRFLPIAMSGWRWFSRRSTFAEYLLSFYVMSFISRS